MLNFTFLATMSPIMKDSFGELRSMIERPSTTQNFTHLIYFIEQHLTSGATSREAIEAQWIPYLTDKLATWPDRTRECPRELLDGYESNEAVWAPLIRSVNFASEAFSKARHQRLLKATHMGEVTALDLSAVRLSWEQLEELIKGSPFGQLEAFAFRKTLKKTDYPQLGALFASPLLAHVQALSFSRWDNIKSDVYDLLIEHFPLENLRELDLSGSRIISPKRMKDLLQTGKLDELERLMFATLGSENLYDGMLATLAKYDKLSKLKELRINGGTAKDLDAFVKSNNFNSLQRLKVSGWEYGTSARYREMWKPHHIEALLDEEHFPTLSEVRIELFQEDVLPGLEALAGEVVSKLDSLDLRLYLTAEEVTPALERALNQALSGEVMRNLSRLSLNLIHPTELDVDAGSRAVTMACHALGKAPLTSLRALRICQRRTHPMMPPLDGAIAPIIAASYFENLEELQMLGTGFWDEDLSLLAERGKTFRALGFDTPFGERALEIVRTSKLLSEVEVLRLGDIDLRSQDESVLDTLTREALLSLIHEHDALPQLQLLLDHYGNMSLNEDHFLHESDPASQRPIIVTRDFTFSDDSPVWLLRRGSEEPF